MRTLLTILLFLAHPATAEYIPRSDINYGNWSGAAYTYDATGAFSHCVVSAPYLSGDTLYLSVGEGAIVSVGIESPALMLQPGQDIAVTLYVDRLPPIYGRAVALQSNFAKLILPDFKKSLFTLQKGKMLVVESAAGRGIYDLTGTFRALNLTLECAIRHLDYVAQPASPVSPPNNISPVERTVLFQLATGMISDLGIADFQYLSESETKALFPSDAVAWKSESMGVLGGVVAVSSDGLTELKQTDKEDYGFLSNDCDGDVATTARDVSLPEYKSRELRSICVESGGSTESLLNKTLVGNTVIYTLLVFGQSSSINEPAQRKQMSEQSALRAARYVRSP